MLTFLLTRPSADALRFYRVEVGYNLFGEYSVVREWGKAGRHGQQILVWFSNLRDACFAAERWRKQAMRRGYELEGIKQ